MSISKAWQGLAKGSIVKYTPIQGSDDSENDLHKPEGRPNRASRGYLCIVFVVLVLSLSSLIFSNRVPLPQTTWQSETSNPPPGMVHLLVPANKANEHACKTILTAGVLGYPSPTLINWNQTFNDTKLSDKGSHIAKIAGIQRYLAKIPVDRNDDLVLVVDGYDTWFQLRPQTLIERYFDTIERSNERITRQLGKKLVKQHGITQKIVFSTQKQCWPWKDEDAPCSAVPTSTLPEDAYGADTDVFYNGTRNPFWKLRPRWLNSGVAIGTVGAMRTLYDEAWKLMQADKNTGSDQYILGQLFGEQEVYRDLLRNNAAPADSPPREFNLGVDYESSISLATIFADNDTAWLNSHNTSQIDMINTRMGIPNTRVTTLSLDISATEPPFHKLNTSINATTWSHAPLLTDMWTGVAPAIIHHNAWQRDLKSRRRTHWPSTWWQAQARALLDAEVLAAPAPIAYAGYGHAKRAWWPVEDYKIGARADVNATSKESGGKWMGFESLCKDEKIAKELFRDERGAWKRPAWEPK